MKHTAPATRSITGPAGKLRVTTEGDGGVPVLFVHDNAGDHTHWAEAQHSLQTKTVAFDLRGMGESGAQHEFGVSAGVEDVQAVAEALLPERFVLVGHGFGAAVAGEFAAYYPERLAGLLYVDPPRDLRSTPAAEREALLAHFNTAQYGSFAESWLAVPLLGSKTSTRSLVLSTLQTSRREAVAANLESLYHHDPSAAFEGFTGPTHALVSKSEPGDFLSAHPGLSHALAPHSSHWLMLDAPQWFHTGLVHFLGICRHGTAPHAEHAPRT